MNSNKIISKKYILFGIILLTPRIFRFLYPKVWLEDPYYLYAGYLIKNGFLPYLNFGHTQLPGVEYLLSFFYTIFGSSYRVAEVLTQLLVFFTSCFIFYTGKKLKDDIAGLSAAIIFSYSSLIFRYHVLEREIFILFIIGIICVLFLHWDKITIQKILFLSICLWLAIIFKLTSMILFGAVLLYLIFFQKDIKSMVLTLLFTSILMIITLIVLYFTAKDKFIQQVFIYHFIKGKNFISCWQMLKFPSKVLDIPLSLGISGIIFAFPKKFNKILKFLMVFTLGESIFFSLISPNAWPHNYLTTLFFLSLMGGMFTEKLIKEIHRKKFIKICIMLLLPLILLKFICPIHNSNWVLNSKYGFGYIDRKEITEITRFIKFHTSKKDLLLIPQYINIINDRLEATGVIQWLKKELQRKKLKEILKSVKNKSFKQMIKETIKDGWMNVNIKLIYHKIKFIIPDIVPGEKIPFSKNYLLKIGYQPIYRTTHYVIWGTK